MKVNLAMLLPAKRDIRWELAAQAGVTHAVSKLVGVYEPWRLESLQAAVKSFADAGFKLHALEGDQFDMNRIKLGLPGRDEDIARYKAMLQCMGQCDIRILTYNFMAGVGWYRNNTQRLERGGALTSAYEPSLEEDIPLKFSHEKLWENYTYFIKAVMPTAEAAGVKMALHPDDPPVEVLCGYPRIFGRVESFDRALEIGASPSACITLCIANFAEMGADDLALMEKWHNKVVFAHFRSNRKLADGGFVETFHDNGPTDMVARFAKLKELGIEEILLRPDHAPTMFGEDNSEPGYAALGRMFAIGYFKGIMDSLGIQY